MNNIRCIQVNLHHAKGASSILSRRFTKEQLGIALVQEPWVNHNKILGLSCQSSRLIYSNTQATPRTAILLSGNIKCTPITEFVQRDIVAAMVTVPTTKGKQEMVVASAYFPGDQDDVPPPEVAALVRYCRAVNKPFLIGCDANAHHTIWGSTDVNDRADTIMAELINLLRASFTLGYIPRSWRKVKVIFIPKAGRNDPTMPKAFRPISLTVTLLKLMEKITDNHIRAEFLKDFPLHKHQYAYQAGKSTETALHALV
ncbi:uncharacterized protein LOC119769175 [Culex quinquefasciatus]|uniref:uncharacterized protein LOC119769175 n=1 Tax=Culex quinquefasciatus TaxID=7176 RepID=UPI0018E34EF2|nr:uncharacterized protein LOC119769175 [Culex quinquefasciatus]